MSRLFTTYGSFKLHGFAALTCVMVSLSGVPTASAQQRAATSAQPVAQQVDHGALLQQARRDADQVFESFQTCSKEAVKNSDLVRCERTAARQMRPLRAMSRRHIDADQGRALGHIKSLQSKIRAQAQVIGRYMRNQRRKAKAAAPK